MAMDTIACFHFGRTLLNFIFVNLQIYWFVLEWTESRVEDILASVLEFGVVKTVLFNAQQSESSCPVSQQITTTYAL